MIKGLRIAAELLAINVLLITILIFIGWDTYESIRPETWGAAGRYFYLTTNILSIVLLLSRYKPKTKAL